jgi:hypothetical protein
LTLVQGTKEEDWKQLYERRDRRSV